MNYTKNTINLGQICPNKSELVTINFDGMRHNQEERARISFKLPATTDCSDQTKHELMIRH